MASLHRYTGRPHAFSIAPCRSKSAHACIAPRGAATSLSQFQSSNGVAIPMPAMRARLGARRSLRSAAHPRAGEIDKRSGGRVEVGRVDRAADVADEIHQDDFRAPPPDLHPERECSFRIERKRHRRLPDPPTQRLPLQHQAIGFERLHDHLHGRRRKAGEAGDVGLRKRTVVADQRKHQPLIVEPHPARVGSPPKLRRDACRDRVEDRPSLISSAAKLLHAACMMSRIN